MINIKLKLEKAGKTTSDYLNYLEDGRYNHGLLGYEGKTMVITEQNGGSANEISIHPDLMDNFNEFLKLMKD
jgi:hypothetical protein